MSRPATPDTPRTPRWGWAWAAAVWLAAWVAMAHLEGRIGLAQVAITIVLAATLSAIWLPIAATIATSTASVLAFDWFFIPPRFSLRIHTAEDALLLAEVLALSWVIAGLLEGARVLARRARRSAGYANQLRSLGDALRDAEDPARRGDALRSALQELFGRGATLLLVRDGDALSCDPADSVTLGPAGADELAGLWQCARLVKAFGAGTGSEALLPALYLPIVGGEDESYGAAVVSVPPGETVRPQVLAQARTLCDHMGQFMRRVRTQREAELAQGRAQEQSVRNALLAAISHDYRTPLAAIMSAASALLEQGRKLAPEQRDRLAATIVAETRQLNRMTDNTLQLVRLDAAGVTLNLDWESPDELAGVAAARARAHDRERKLKVWSEPDLPLIRCDAVLFSQLLENLIDNALKYSDPEATVQLTVRQVADHVVFAVKDRGPGIDPQWREKIFDVFQRGDWRKTTSNSAAQRGAGVGLAVCRAIARAHGGELRLRQRGSGGSSFECWLPLQPAPPMEADAAQADRARA
jgi:two-component system sensor histidine kinase KdpD